MAHTNPIVDDSRPEALIKFINQQFHSRVITEGKKQGKNFGITLDTEVVEKVLWLTFANNKERHSVTIPIPHVESGATILCQNEVKRVVCSYYFRNIDQVVSYLGVMYTIICGEPDGVVSQSFVKGTPFLQRIINSFQYGNTATLVYNLQRAVNEVVNKLPLHETPLNSWVMNRRLCIIDPDFDELNDPAEKLEYQVEKNKQYFSRGWTSIGMSDGNLADKNYILTTDIRKLSPFSLAHNNPGRNLYSTLGMKGDELPTIRSRSMQTLMDQGVTRTGWNLTTLFVDVPEVFEDQILVDRSHADKYVVYTRRYQCFGQIMVKKGDVLKRGTILSIAEDGEEKKFDLNDPHAKVRKISKGVTNVGGIETGVYNVIVTYRRYFKDGTKFTNLHGNKGVIKMKDLGYATHPSTGHRIKIDVISASTSIKKRKNFGQIIEAIKTNILGTRQHMSAAVTREKMNRLRGVTPKCDRRALVFEDDYQCTSQSLERELEASGFPKDGTWKCDTHLGELKGVVGKVFWGVIAQPEGSLWNRGATTKKNGRELRTAGLKFSTVEFRALSTRFGKDNAVLDEIMSYAQGTEDLHEKLSILKSKVGQLPSRKPVVSVSDLKWVNQMDGTIMDKSAVLGTVVDELIYPGGFILQMPAAYQVAIPADPTQEVSEGGVRDVFPHENMKSVHRFSQIYIPDATLRKCWRHSTGKYGLSEIGAIVNNMIICGNRLAASQDAAAYTLFYQSIYMYFNRIASMMGSKRGDISTYGMSVRYPYSAKAYATVCNRLPRNTIEIHRNMSRDLRVKNGDIVLVERFPCLGFMSLRPQKIRITDDPNCKYVIRVSDNSLGSLSLDFDGDVLFLASFHTPEAKDALRREFDNPNKSCYDAIKLLNKKAGVPHTKCMNLQDYQIHPFVPLDVETHAELVRRLTGVKSHTGPVIALAYNLMRLIENSSINDNQKTNVAIELFLDKVGNSVFKQKHGVKSLHDVVIDAICTCNVELLVEHGFERGTSTIICNIIIDKAREVGVNDLARYHKEAKEKKRSNIINFLVRKQNKIYFASRALQEGCRLLEHLEQPVVDIPSKMFKWVTSGRANNIVTPLDKHQEERAMRALRNSQTRDACKVLCDVLDEYMVKTIKPKSRCVSPAAIRQKMKDFRRGCK